jgi:hypothetical protein
VKPTPLFLAVSQPAPFTRSYEVTE